MGDIQDVHARMNADSAPNRFLYSQPPNASKVYNPGISAVKRSTKDTRSLNPNFKGNLSEAISYIIEKTK